MQFQIVIPMYNAAPWIEENLHTLQKQSYRNFRCIVIDDLSTDDSAARAGAQIRTDSRFTLLTNRTKRYSMGNVCKAIEHGRPEDEDVVVLVDADDRLAHNDVLQHLADVYRRSQGWMTYGTYGDRSSGERDPICRPYPEAVVKKGLFRKCKWRASHLKTFKYHLWPHVHPESFTISAAEIRRETLRAMLCGRIRAWLRWRRIRAADLVDATGRYVRRCVDKAITYPLLDLAGPKSVFVKEILYLYTSYEKALPYRADIDAKWCRRLVRTVLKNKKPHPCLAA